ncbi:MAG: alpha-amylase/4-alpha-glucanotransferase domain-containing protein, partial [Terriglobia bacterium]
MAHPKVSLCLVIHSHQPVGNFDHVIENAYQRSYLPFLNVLGRHPRIALSLHYSGVLWEWLEARHPEFMRQVGELTERGQVEHVGGGYFEPILAAIPDEWKVRQIRRQSEFLRSRFGAIPRGAWVAERVWEQGLIAPLAEGGAEYTVLDDTHFLAAGEDPVDLHQAYLTEESGVALTLVPSLQALRYTIPFRDPEETLAVLKAGYDSSQTLFAVGDDCEKFGVWPGTHEHCYTNGWLERFFQTLEAARDWLDVTTVSRYLSASAPERRIYLPTASYAEMMMWALPAAATQELEACVEETQRMPDGSKFRRFLRGAPWRNFLSKYPESNQVQKLMLRLACRWREQHRVVAAGSAEDGLLTQVENHLLAAQCNDSYWHGIFGGLYAPHLRSAVQGRLIRAEAILDRMEENGGSAARIEVVDFDVDGHDELLIEHPEAAAIIRPADGGTVSSLRSKRAGAELINSLRRRPEAYHRRLRESG